MIAEIKKGHAVRLGLAAALAIAPLAHADDVGQIHIAAAIGAEAKPTVVAPTAPSQTPAGEPADEGGGVTSAEIWVGVGVAAFLAAVGGGGGGGGSPTSSP